MSTQLDDLKKEVAELSKTVTDLRIDLAGKIATLEAKSGAWGAIAAIAVLILALLLRKLTGM